MHSLDALKPFSASGTQGFYSVEAGNILCGTTVLSSHCFDDVIQGNAHVGLLKTTAVTAGGKDFLVIVDTAVLLNTSEQIACPCLKPFSI